MVRAIYSAGLLYPRDYVSQENAWSSAITTRQKVAHSLYVFAGYRRLILYILADFQVLGRLHRDPEFLHDYFISQFHHNYLITARKQIATEDIMKNLDYIHCPSRKVLHCATVRRHYRPRTHRQTAHAPYCIILRRAAWAGWPRGDLHLRLTREIPPECKLAKESELRESPYIIDSPRSLS